MGPGRKARISVNISEKTEEAKIEPAGLEITGSQDPEDPPLRAAPHTHNKCAN